MGFTASNGLFYYLNWLFYNRGLDGGQLFIVEVGQGQGKICATLGGFDLEAKGLGEIPRT